jgi:hypothetical protein
MRFIHRINYRRKSEREFVISITKSAEHYSVDVWIPASGQNESGEASWKRLPPKTHQPLKQNNNVQSTPATARQAGYDKR